MSTPSKCGAAGVLKPTLDKFKPCLIEDLKDELFINAEIEKFVQHVWGMTEKDVSFIIKNFRQSWLDRELVAEFETSSKGNEIYMYRPFQKVAEALTNVVREKMKVGTGKSTIQYWNDEGYYILPSAAARKPDILPMHNLVTLVGRGTMVYGVTRTHADDREEVNQALKMGWPVTSGQLEASIIEKPCKDIAAWKDHLPEVYFTMTVSAAQLKLPRVELLTASPVDWASRIATFMRWG
jgi:hypothetical protein